MKIPVDPLGVASEHDIIHKWTLNLCDCICLIWFCLKYVPVHCYEQQVEIKQLCFAVKKLKLIEMGNEEGEMICFRRRQYNFCAKKY